MHSAVHMHVVSPIMITKTMLKSLGKKINEQSWYNHARCTMINTVCQQQLIYACTQWILKCGRCGPHGPHTGDRWGIHSSACRMTHMWPCGHTPETHSPQENPCISYRGSHLEPLEMQIHKDRWYNRTACNIHSISHPNCMTKLCVIK